MDALGLLSSHSLRGGREGGLRLHIIEPVGYLDMLVLERSARLILTDSGGVQKEAYFFAVPCLTLREETEWVETVESGWNRLVGADRTAIVTAAQASWPEGKPPSVFGDGHAADKIAGLLVEQLVVGMQGGGVTVKPSLSLRAFRKFPEG
jgi:UDP-N-acetylglucosamine 2-epimerase